jgi:hypothetical protein
MLLTTAVKISSQKINAERPVGAMKPRGLRLTAAKESGRFWLHHQRAEPELAVKVDWTRDARLTLVGFDLRTDSDFAVCAAARTPPPNSLEFIVPSA